MNFKEFMECLKERDLEELFDGMWTGMVVLTISCAFIFFLINLPIPTILVALFLVASFFFGNFIK